MELNLLLVWGALTAEARLIGQHVVRNVVVRPQPASRQCPLTLTVKYAPRTSHNFSAGTPCAVEVSVCVRNGAAPTSQPTSFAFKLLPPEEARASSGGNVPSVKVGRSSPLVTLTARVRLNLPACLPAHLLACLSASLPVNAKALRPRFFWAGCTRRWIEQLPPGATITIGLKAVFPGPGVYNLNRFQFHVHHMDSTKPTIFVFPRWVGRSGQSLPLRGRRVARRATTLRVCVAGCLVVWLSGCELTGCWEVAD